MVRTLGEQRQLWCCCSCSQWLTGLCITQWAAQQGAHIYHTVNRTVTLLTERHANSGSFCTAKAPALSFCGYCTSNWHAVRHLMTLGQASQASTSAHAASGVHSIGHPSIHLLKCRCTHWPVLKHCLRNSTVICKCLICY
jgi:hypothetical protein